MRVEEMFERGVIQEVKNFSTMKVDKELSPNKIIGINEINDYLKGKMTFLKEK